jgi:hypothetical protein
MAGIGLPHSLFSMVPRLFAAEFHALIIEILNALAVIWKRLATSGLPAAFSSECLA